MNATLAVHRIDRERATLHKAVADRILRAERTRQPIAESIERLAMLAYLRGMKRAVVDATEAMKRDVRVSHLLLSKEDEKRERDLLLWLIAFLGLPAAAVETIRASAQDVAANAAEQIRAVAVKASQRVIEQERSNGNEVSADGRRSGLESNRVRDGGRTEGAGRVSRPPSGSRTHSGTYRSSGNGTGEPATSAGDRVGVEQRAGGLVSDPDVFGRFGRTDVHLTVPQSAIDTWAETVAYTQYERGRWDAADQSPAISEALWGYRWSSVLDTRTTTGCRILDGWTAPVSDTYMQQLRPPRHFNCRAVLVPVYQSSRLKRPVEVKRPSDATLARYLEQKEQFLRYAA